MNTITVSMLEYGYSTPLSSPLSFSCQSGEVTAVLGSNGRGKTTLLHTIIGLIPVLNGNITCNGGIGFVPQIFTANFDYSVLDIVLMGRAATIGILQTPSREDEQIARAALHKLEISDLAERSYNTLSGGQRQLVLIARALSAQGQTLILDEPTAALDLSNQQTVLRLIKSLAKNDGMSVIFSTHEPTHALLTADRTILMLPDQEWLYSSNEDILTEQNLRKAYGITIRELSINGQHALVPEYEI